MALLGAQFVNAVSPNPVGSLQAYAGASAPTGWLLCDYSEQPISTYPELYSVLGTTYGSLTNGSGGAGSTHFRLPDLRGRMPVGADNMGGSAASRLTSGGSGVDGATLGATGGAETHTMTTTEMPSHTHTQNAHTHTQNSHNHSQAPHVHGAIATAGGGGGSAVATWTVGGAYGGNATNFGYTSYTTASNYATTATNQNTTATNQNTGGGGAHNNVQPVIVTNYIIKAVPDAPRSGLAYGSTPPIVTALPANPQFGDVVTYAADATNGVYWSLQYDASGTYPWKYIGGPPLYDAGGGYQAITSTSYVDLTGVTINTALAGDYDVRLDAQLQQPTGNGYVTYLSVSHAGGTLGDYTYPIVYAPFTSSTDNGASRVARILDLAANNTLQGRAKVNAGTGYVGYCRLTATPVRVAA